MHQNVMYALPIFFYLMQNFMTSKLVALKCCDVTQRSMLRTVVCPQ